MFSTQNIQFIFPTLQHICWGILSFNNASHTSFSHRWWQYLYSIKRRDWARESQTKRGLNTIYASKCMYFALTKFTHAYCKIMQTLADSETHTYITRAHTQCSIVQFHICVSFYHWFFITRVFHSKCEYQFWSFVLRCDIVLADISADVIRCTLSSPTMPL